MGEQHAGGTDGRKKWRMIQAAGTVSVVGFLDFVGAGEGKLDGALASSFFAHGFRDGFEGGDVFFALLHALLLVQEGFVMSGGHNGGGSFLKWGMLEVDTTDTVSGHGGGGSFLEVPF